MPAPVSQTLGDVIILYKSQKQHLELYKPLKLFIKIQTNSFHGSFSRLLNKSPTIISMAAHLISHKHEGKVLMVSARDGGSSWCVRFASRPLREICSLAKKVCRGATLFIFGTSKLCILPSPLLTHTTASLLSKVQICFVSGSLQPIFEFHTSRSTKHRLIL